MKSKLSRPICLLAAPAAFSLTTGAWSAPEESPVKTDVVFSAGREGGGYRSVGDRMEKVAGESGRGVAIHRSVGLLKNLSEWMRTYSVNP